MLIMSHRYLSVILPARMLQFVEILLALRRVLTNNSLRLCNATTYYDETQAAAKLTASSVETEDYIVRTTILITAACDELKKMLRGKPVNIESETSLQAGWETRTHCMPMAPRNRLWLQLMDLWETKTFRRCFEPWCATSSWFVSLPAARAFCSIVSFC